MNTDAIAGLVKPLKVKLPPVDMEALAALVSGPTLTIPRKPTNSTKVVNE